MPQCCGCATAPLAAACASFTAGAEGVAVGGLLLAASALPGAAAGVLGCPVGRPWAARTMSSGEGVSNWKGCMSAADLLVGARSKVCWHWLGVAAFRPAVTHVPGATSCCGTAVCLQLGQLLECRLLPVTLEG